MSYLKGILLTILLLGAVKLGIVIAEDYRARMVEHNRYMCAVYGKQADCTTPLKEEDKLR